ncbi:MAG: hypothetical protein IID03_12680 [Candidatus Dadabacteria bacterium]|nr:hypothetical protein [Candidatus Dadabacteria bacterium]
MALVTAIQSIGSFSDALVFAQDIIQDVVRIRRLSAGIAPPFSLTNPFAVSDSEIFLNITEVEELTYKVVITEKPVGDIGAASDYISRESTPLILTSLISNRSFNVLNDPVQALTDIANSFAPAVAAGIETGKSIAGKFIDLGADEIDLKIRNLRAWQLKGEIVQVLGVRLDPFNHMTKNDTFNFLIEEIALTYDKSFGDSVGLTITMKNLLNLDDGVVNKDKEPTKRGGKLGESLGLVLPPGSNPF